MEKLVLLMAVVAASNALSFVPLVRPCPHILCLAQICEPPKISRETFLTFRGERCRACTLCVDPPKPKPRCPDIQCDIPICQPGEFLYLDTTFENERRICQGCPECRAAPNPLPSFCPTIDCLPDPIDCENPQCSISTFRGAECRACCTCPLVFESTRPSESVSSTTTTTVATTPPQNCPRVTCFLTRPCRNDEELVDTTFEYNGGMCRGCPKCQLKPDTTCPLARCLFHLGLPCIDEYERTPSAFENSNGEICLGCSGCFPKCSSVACLEPSCGILDQIPTTIVQNGRACPGCPICRETTTPSTTTSTGYH